MQDSQSTVFMVLAALFAALTGVSSFFKIPIPPVPVSMQTFIVMLSGFLLGARYGAISQLLYVIIGLAGLPIFASGGGPGYVLKPTFGYLLGYIGAAYLIGRLTHGGSAPRNMLQIFDKIQSLSPVSLAGNALAGMLCIFVPGVLYLYFISRFYLGNAIELTQAFYAGFVIFIPVDIIKITIAVFLLKLISARFRSARA